MAYAKSEATQRRLLDAMARLLRTKGYAATGLRAVVALSGVPKGSLYHHFPSGKAELAAAAVRLAGDEVVERLGADAARGEDPTHLVTRYCDRAIAELRASDYLSCSPVSTVSLELGPDAALVQDACACAFEDLVEAFAARFEAAGVPKERAHELGTFVLASIEGGTLLAKARRDVEPLELIRRELAVMLAAALMRRRG